MLKKILPVIVALSLVFGAFSLTSFATDNPSTFQPSSEPTLAPRITYYNTHNYSLIYRDEFTVYNPYRLNQFDFEEALYTYNKGVNVTSSRFSLMTNAFYWYHEDEALSVDLFKTWHRDENGKLYFINSVAVPSEIETEYDGAHFILESDWFNFKSIADTRNIGIYITSNDEITYYADIKLYGFDVQTNTTRFLTFSDVAINTAEYNKVPLSSLFSQLDQNAPDGMTFEYYRIVCASVDEGFYPTEIGFMTPFTVAGGLEPSITSDIFVRDGTTDPSVSVVSYADFNLLDWLGTSVEGFITTPLFVVGKVTVTIGGLLGLVFGFWIFIAFIKKFAGG